MVLRVPGLPALLQRQRRRPDLPAFTPSPRLRRGARAGTQASLRLPHRTPLHGGGCPGGETLICHFQATLSSSEVEADVLASLLLVFVFSGQQL